MAADNNLKDAALIDIKEMESVNYYGSGIKVIALLDTPFGANIYEVSFDESKSRDNITSKKVEALFPGNSKINMGDGEVLKQFIAFSKQKYPSERYSLIIWNHGEGLRVCQDGGSNDWLTTVELEAALKDHFFEFIGFDACFMSVTDVAYCLKNSSDIMVASQDFEEEGGWDYTYILKEFAKSHKNGETMGKILVNSYTNKYSGKNLSLYYLRNIDNYINELYLFYEELKKLDKAVIKRIILGIPPINNSFYDAKSVFLAFYSIFDTKSVSNELDLFVAFGGTSLYFPTQKQDIDVAFYSNNGLFRDYFDVLLQ